MCSMLRDLVAVRNSERGRKAFIIGNGPSVQNEPLEMLRGQLSISMNAGVLLAEEYDFFSKYYALSDQRFLLNSFKRPMATKRLPSNTIRFLRSDLQEFDESDGRHVTYYIPPIARDGFSTDLRRGFYYGSTTALFAMQIAVWLGVSEIAMLGVDLHYPEDRPRFYREKHREEEDIMMSVQIRNIADAARTCEAMGINVVSCSERSLLRSYIDYRPFVDVVRGPRRFVNSLGSLRTLLSSRSSQLISRTLAKGAS